MTSFATFLAQRSRAAGLAAAFGLAVHVAMPAPPERSVEGLAEMLGRAVSGEVAASDIAWEPRRGIVHEIFFGRPVLFLARSEPDAPRDLYRANVRVTTGGQPIDVRRVRNLTETPLGDDAALEIQGFWAVYATVAFDRIQAVTILDVDGIRADDRQGGWLQRLLLPIEGYLRTGSIEGIGRTDIVFDLPARRARLTLTDDPDRGATLGVDLGDDARSLVYAVESRELRGADGGPPYAARLVPHVRRPKPFILWAVDTVRGEVGPDAVAWLENTVFGARDLVRRNTYALFANDELRDDTDEPSDDESEDGEAEEAEAAWPPPSIPSLWKEIKPGEGEWAPVTLPWIQYPPGADPDAERDPAFYQTFIRPDPKRPYAEVLLIAMDMRQLELGMQAGYEDPKPLTGPPGTGKLPDDPNLRRRIVATFNGAFKTTHGKYGMMVDGRVLVPPMPGGATVIVTEDDRVGLGNWPPTEDIPEYVRSFRQNLDPLVEDGVANPSGRYIWGWQLAGTSMLTQRTALCVMPGGHLLYAWGREIDGPTLGQAMRQAGCSYAIHLDMNPEHCGFVYTDIVDVENEEFQLKLADEGMGILPSKYVRWSAKDFFWMAFRDPVPDDADVSWELDPGKQPAPEWLPGIFSATVELGALRVDLTSFDPGRTDWIVRAGTEEPPVVDAPPMEQELDEGLRGRAVAAVGLGYTTPATKYGIAFNREPSLAMRSSYATVLVGPGVGLSIAAPGEAVKVPKRGEAVQLPLLADEGELAGDVVGDAGAMRVRGALCVDPAGRVIVARGEHDSYDPIASALLRVGCRRVVALDRGSHHPPFLDRAGTDDAPSVRYETSVLYALGRPMTPRGFRWKAEGAQPSREPTTPDYNPDAGKLFYPGKRPPGQPR